MIKKNNIEEKHPIQLSDNKQIVYKVEFVEKIKNSDLGKFTCIGIFSSDRNAEEAVSLLLMEDKFKKYTNENFIIEPCAVDLIYWFDGFVQKYY